MNENFKTILAGFSEFFLAAIIAAFVVGCVYLDITTYGDILENSFVELAQELLLLLITGFFILSANKQRSGGLWLVAGFFGCLFIRELDAYFDQIVHGAWKYFALVLVVFIFFKAWKLGIKNTTETLANFIKSRSFIFIFIGLLVVLAYSRLFGMGELWHTIMGEKYIRTVKNVVEEGTELFGYALVFWGAINYFFTSKRG